MIRLRIVPTLGHFRLNQLTRHQIQTFHTDLRTEGLAPATCDHHLKLLRSALNLAVLWEMLDKNPVAKVPLFREDNKLERYLSDEELNRLLVVLRTSQGPNGMQCNAIPARDRRPPERSPAGPLGAYRQSKPDLEDSGEEQQV